MHKGAEIDDKEGFARAELLQVGQASTSLHHCARCFIEKAQGLGGGARHHGSESAARFAGAGEVGRVEPA